MTYTKPQRGATIPTITHNGVTADRHEDKVQILMEISFPAPVPYEGDEGVPAPPGQVYKLVSDRMVAMAFSGTSTKKSPGPN